MITHDSSRRIQLKTDLFISFAFFDLVEESFKRALLFASDLHLEQTNKSSTVMYNIFEAKDMLPRGGEIVKFS